MAMKLLLLIFLTLTLTACSDSDNNPESGGNDGSTGDSLTVYATDVYQPDNAITNVCSSPLWESVAGNYSGTIDIELAGTSAGGTAPSCNWDVEFAMKREYEPNTNRGVCNLKTDFNSSITFKSDELNCVDMNVSGLVKTSFQESELVNPNQSVALRLNLEPVLISSNPGLPPLGGPSNNRIESVLFGLDGFGNMQHIDDFDLGSPEFIYQYDIQRMSADIPQSLIE